MTKEEFVEIFQLYSAHIYNFIYLRVNSREVAQDLAQEVFMKVWKARKDYNSDKSSIKTWIFKIARNNLIDFYRKKGREIKVENLDTMDIGKEDNLNEELDQIILTIRKLDPQDQELIILRYIEGLTNEEISLVINKSVNTTKVAVFRSFNKLKKLLDNEI